jgi:hypothetical protein
MAIRNREGKKGVTWQIDYVDPNGNRHHFSVGLMNSIPPM